VRGQRGFEQYQLLKLNPLAQSGDVIDHDAGKFFALQPDTGEGMAPGENQDRIQPRLFNGRAKKQREIEAGRQPQLGNLPRRAHFLAGMLEAGGRQCIVQPHRGHGAPDAGGQFPGPLRATGVTIQRWILGVLAQNLSALLEHPLNRRLVRLHEGRDHVRQVG